MSVLRNIKSLAPLLDRVLVQRIKPEAKTASGIFLPESSVKEQNEAKVLAVGPGAFDKDGKRLPMGVASGDKVLIPQVRCALLVSAFFRVASAMQYIALTTPNSYDLIESMLTCLSHQFGGSPLKVGEDEYTLFRDSEILAKINE
ncbi:unnamed protein product [Penicillium pancosmium]